MTTLALYYILGLCTGIFGLAFWLEYQLKKQEDAIYDTNRIDVRKYGLIND